MKDKTTQQKKGKEITTQLLVKSTFWHTAATFFTRAIAFITIPIFTRLLTKAQFGDFTNFASWQSIFVIVCGLEIYSTINRARFDYTGEGELDGYITSCLMLSTIMTSVALGLYLLFPHKAYDLLLVEPKYMAVMFLYLYTYPAYLMFQIKQRIEYRYKLNAAIAFCLVLVSSLCAIMMVKLWDSDRLMGRIAGQYVPFAIVGLCFYIYFASKSLKIRPSSWAYGLRIGLPLVFSYIGSSILLHSDNIIVKHLSTAESVGNLSIAHSCAHIILIFVNVLSQSWAPWFYDKLNLNEFKSISRILRLYLWFTVFCTLCVMLVGPEIVTILGGAKYRDAIYLLPPTMLCGILATLTDKFVSYETFHKKNHYAAVLTTIIAVFNIFLDIIGVKQFGYIAVCYATVISYIILNLLHFHFTNKMGIRKILSFKDVALIMGVSLAMIPMALLLYKYTLIRWCVIAAIAATACVILWIKRVEVKTLIRRFRHKENKAPKPVEE